MKVYRWMLLSLLVATPCAAQLPVTDAASNMQRMIEFIVQQGNEVRKYAEMVTTAKNMVEQVKGTYQMLDYMAQNIKNMPLDTSFVDWLLETNNQVTSLLGQVAWIGFTLDNASQQFETLYRNTAALATPEGRAQRLAAMQEARLQLSGAAMQLQSIRQTFGGFLDRLTALLGFASGADGAKALQQIQVQQAALAQQQQQFGLTLEAVANRLITMQQAEEIVKAQMHNIAAQQLADQWYGTTGYDLPPGWNGFRILGAGGQ